MSNMLAIAAVTQILKDLLNDTLVNGDASRIMGSDFTVTALPPDQVVSDSADQPAQLNLFLYRLSQNEAYRNTDLPTRDASGRLTQRPRLALDLHYILTAVSGAELHSEILLGYAMQMFHETAIFGRERIREALDLASIDDILTPEFDTLRASEIADQIETIKITPRTLTMDDMSKLFTAFQASYRTTVAYDVSLVLIERELPVRPTLPVLSRGGLRDPDTGRDPGVSVRPDVLPPVPTISAIRSLDDHPVMRLGGQIEITGFRLDGGNPGAESVVRFTEPGNGQTLELAPMSPSAPSRLLVTLPGAAALAPGNPAIGTALDPASWRVGAYAIDVTVRHPDGREQVSNGLPLALAPASTSSALAAPPDVNITMTCAPPIRPGQTVAILARQDMVVLPSPPAPLSAVTAGFAGLTSGSEVPVRLRVDGVDSPVIDLTTTPPSLETVTVP